MPGTEPTPDMGTPPADYGSDRYDYVEVQGADNRQPSGPWFDMLLAEACPDCRPNVFLRWLDQPLEPSERAAWHVTVAHDDQCPTWRAVGET